MIFLAGWPSQDVLLEYFGSDTFCPHTNSMRLSMKPPIEKEILQWKVGSGSRVLQFSQTLLHHNLDHRTEKEKINANESIMVVKFLAGDAENHIVSLTDYDGSPVKLL